MQSKTLLLLYIKKNNNEYIYTHTDRYKYEKEVLYAINTKIRVVREKYRLPDFMSVFTAEVLAIRRAVEIVNGKRI